MGDAKEKDNQEESSEREVSEQSQAEVGAQYRVNRLGREIFSGDRLLLVRAIQARKIRGDDLIYDQEYDVWSFARKHEIFLEATGQGLDELQRQRAQQSSRGKWLRFIFNVGLIVLILSYLTMISKNIEFKLGDGEVDEFEMVSSQTTSSQEQTEDSRSEAEGSTGSEGEDEESEGYAALSELLQAQERARPALGEEIKQVFDLSADGMRDSPLVQQSTLSDEELIERAQVISSEASRQLRDEERFEIKIYSQLQEARAVVTFVSQRNPTHQGAGVLLSQIKTQLKQACASLYDVAFCKVKDRHPEWRDAVIRSVLRREVLFGMTASQVEAAWGRASEVRRERGGARHCYGPGCERSVWIVDGEVREFGQPSEKKRERSSRKRRSSARRTR